jgi:hypothetical protein
MLKVVCSGVLSCDCCLHRPLVASLNIVSFSNKLSCLAIGSTRGPLQETINTMISFLVPLPYHSATTGELDWGQLFIRMRDTSGHRLGHTSEKPVRFLLFPHLFNFPSKRNMYSLQFQKKMFTKVIKL